MNQFHLQLSGTEEAVHEWHQLATHVLFPVIWKMKLPGQKGKTTVVVGRIAHDVHVQVPKLKVCALCVTSCTSSLILKAGGKILSFTQLALDTLKGYGNILLSGPSKGQEVCRYFGKALGTLHICTKPYIYSMGQKF